MEYMLFPDGTVRAYANIHSVPSVLHELRCAGGIEYYWRANDKSWGRITLEGGAHTLDVDYERDVPDVIKLAVMME